MLSPLFDELSWPIFCICLYLQNRVLQIEIATLLRTVLARVQLHDMYIKQHNMHYLAVSLSPSDRKHIMSMRPMTGLINSASCFRTRDHENHGLDCAADLSNDKTWMVDWKICKATQSRYSCISQFPYTMKYEYLLTNMIGQSKLKNNVVSIKRTIIARPVFELQESFSHLYFVMQLPLWFLN